jgi:hypothetical protein
MASLEHTRVANMSVLREFFEPYFCMCQLLFFLALAFSLQFFASMNSELHFRHVPWPLLHSGHRVCFRTLAVTPYPDHTDSFVVCVGVVACGYAMPERRSSK